MTDTTAQKGPAWPDHMEQIEKTICDKLITAIFKRSYEIRVEYNTGEPLTKFTRDRKTVQRATAASCAPAARAKWFGLSDFFREHFCLTYGETLYCVRDPEKGSRTIGVFSLIHGNGEYVISAATVVPAPLHKAGTRILDFDALPWNDKEKPKIQAILNDICKEAAPEVAYFQYRD